MRHTAQRGRPIVTRHAPDAYGYGQYTTIRRLERSIRRLARAHGLRGDPLADPRPVADDLAGQLAAVSIWLDLPQDLRRHPASWPMTTAAARGGPLRSGRATP